jgi:hypothetical protein
MVLSYCSEFSGILCVTEVYQGQLALLLAVDPAAPDGDRLVGYQLVHGRVDTAVVAGFLSERGGPKLGLTFSPILGIRKRAAREHEMHRGA